MASLGSNSDEKHQDSVSPNTKEVLGVGYRNFGIGKDQQQLAYKQLVTNLLQHEMFKDVKFLNAEDLNFDTRPHTLCYYVCNKLGYARVHWGKHWEKLVKHVVKAMSTARSNASSAIRKGFIRK